MIDPNVIVVVLVALTGVIGMPIIQKVKELLGWQDNAALWLAVGVSVALAVGISFLNGVFTGIEPTVESIAAAAGAVFSLATILYRVIVKGSAVKAEPEANEEA